MPATALRYKGKTMINLEGTSWQQRYGTAEIYTLRFEIADNIATAASAKLLNLFNQNDAHLGDIKLIDLTDVGQIRDFTLHIASKQQIDNIIEQAKSLDGVTLLKSTDEIMEIHSRGTIDVKSRVAIKSLTDLRMVYTPGVAATCEAIVKNPSVARSHTGICDRVAIVTNGTAVLGLGDIGPVPSLPVMEGKAAIFAEFVNISAFPILVDSKDVDEIVETVVKIAGGFGAIQLEDIAAPECFEIEEKLIDRLDIPVFHDDQHGTATVVLAALINGLKQTDKQAKDCKVIMLGAGAAGVAISKILLDFGVDDIVVYDSKGPIWNGRTESMNPYKHQLAKITNKKNSQLSFEDGFKDMDIFIGVARPDMVTEQMISAMNKNSIVFPLSNPKGEISKEQAYKAGAAIAADGRDINNALAYPAIFRGALDSCAKDITMPMKLAAARMIASLAKAGELLPDILDENVHINTAKAVAKAWTDRNVD